MRGNRDTAVIAQDTAANYSRWLRLIISPWLTELSVCMQCVLRAAYRPVSWPAVCSGHQFLLLPAAVLCSMQCCSLLTCNITKTIIVCPCLKMSRSIPIWPMVSLTRQGFSLEMTDVCEDPGLATDHWPMTVSWWPVLLTSDDTQCYLLTINSCQGSPPPCSAPDHRIIRICHSRKKLKNFNFLDLIIRSSKDSLLFNCCGMCNVSQWKITDFAANCMWFNDIIVWFSFNKELASRVCCVAYNCLSNAVVCTPAKSSAQFTSPIQIGTFMTDSDGCQ